MADVSERVVMRRYVSVAEAKKIAADVQTAMASLAERLGQKPGEKSSYRVANVKDCLVIVQNGYSLKAASKLLGLDKAPNGAQRYFTIAKTIVMGETAPPEAYTSWPDAVKAETLETLTEYIKAQKPDKKVTLTAEKFHTRRVKAAGDFENSILNAVIKHENGLGKSKFVKGVTWNIRERVIAKLTGEVGPALVWREITKEDVVKLAQAANG